MEKIESEPSTDLSKMGIRLMRKDDLVLVSSSSRGSRSPENFQMQFKQIRLPSSVKQVFSVAVDLTGFRYKLKNFNLRKFPRISSFM